VPDEGGDASEAAVVALVARIQALTADEGGDASEAAVVALVARIQALTADERQWADAFVAQAADAGVPISASKHRTTRRVAAATAAAALAVLFAEDSTIATDVVAAVLGHDEVQRFSIGALLGSCEIAEAERLVRTVDAIAAGKASLSYPDGRPAVTAA
jgi:hypothetical protein